MASDLVRTVIEPIEWQQSAVLSSGSVPVVQINEPTRDSDHCASQDPAIEEPGQDSLVKARYASTVLRVAQTADQHTAARLLSGLARDFPSRNERVEIAELHFRAIDSFVELATALRTNWLKAARPLEESGECGYGMASSRQWFVRLVPSARVGARQIMPKQHRLS